MEKVIRDGEVAVLTSAYAGRGWYTWDGIEELLFSPYIVNAILSTGSITLNYRDKDHRDIGDKIDAYLEKYNNKYRIIEAPELRVNWIPCGTEFFIKEYDGEETILIKDEIKWLKA